MKLRQHEEQKQVKNILEKHADDTFSYFHLQDNRKYFFSPSGKSFLSFKIWNKVAIVAADPVGPKKEIRILLQSFIQYTYSWKLKPLFVGLSKEYLPLIKALPMKTLKIGEEAIVDLTIFDEKKLKKKVKRAIRHCEHLGIEVFFYNPRTLPRYLSDQIHSISSEWLAKKGKKEKGFTMTLRRIPDEFDEDCQFVLAIKETSLLGFLCFTPVYKSKMLSLDTSRRKDNSYNGLTEYLIFKSAQYFKEQGIKKISLNFAVFSGVIETKASVKQKVLYTTSQILKKLYKSDTLHDFNQKFLPIWESRYIAYPSAKNLPLYLLAILRAER